jgi:hypothetical protein
MDSKISNFVLTDPFPLDQLKDSEFFYDHVAAVWSPEQKRQVMNLKRFDVMHGSLIVQGRMKTADPILSFWILCFRADFNVYDLDATLPQTLSGPDSLTLDFRDYLNQDLKADIVRHIQRIRQKSKTSPKASVQPTQPPKLHKKP